MKKFAKDGTRLRDKKYLDFIRGCNCVWESVAWPKQFPTVPPCFGDIIPAHGKPWGRGIKGPDWNCLPICFHHHNLEHLGELEIKEPARSRLVDAFNKAYCEQNNITLKELRGK